MQWVIFKLIRAPWYNEKGRTIDINSYRPKLKNNKHGEWYRINPVFGGGYVKPDLSGHTIHESYMHENTMLVCLDDSAALEIMGRASNFEVVETKEKIKHQAWKTKVTKIKNFKDFEPTLLTRQEAETIKQSVFGIEPLESGVTDSGVTM